MKSSTERRSAAAGSGGPTDQDLAAQGDAAAELARLTSGRLLAWNTVLNILGQGLPLLVALVAIPLLVQGLGTERFGVLTIAWMAIGYFSLFDLGLGRALTQLVADRLGTGRHHEIGPLVVTALFLVLVLGGIGGLVVSILTPWLVGSVLRIPAELQAEAGTTFYLLAFTLPWVISTAALRGYLEAQQRFGLINLIRVPLGVLTYAGPLLVLPFSSSLVPVVSVLVAGRFIAWLVHLLFCVQILWPDRQRLFFSRESVGPLVRFGSWMTVSNAISPLMVYVDRFLIGASISMAAVAFYVTPYEVITRLWLVPAAMLGVFFPAFATSYRRNPTQLEQLVDRSIRTIFLILFPVCLVAVGFAFEGLNLWLGEEFARNGFRVLQWLTAGVFINSIAQVAFAAIQSTGRPDITGKLHLAELPLYVAAMWWLLGAYGIEGVAIAWTLRIAVDTCALLVVSARLIPAGAAMIRRAARVVVVGLAALGVAAVIPELELRAAYVGLALAFFVWAAWRRVLTGAERSMLRVLWSSARMRIRTG